MLSCYGGYWPRSSRAFIGQNVQICTGAPCQGALNRISQDIRLGTKLEVASFGTWYYFIRCELKLIDYKCALIGHFWHRLENIFQYYCIIGAVRASRLDVFGKHTKFSRNADMSLEQTIHGSKSAVCVRKYHPKTLFCTKQIRKVQQQTMTAKFRIVGQMYPCWSVSEHWTSVPSRKPYILRRFCITLRFSVHWL